jgi:hypothetical protein
MEVRKHDDMGTQSKVEEGEPLNHLYCWSKVDEGGPFNPYAAGAPGCVHIYVIV